MVPEGTDLNQISNAGVDWLTDLAAVHSAVPEADAWLQDQGFWSASLSVIGEGVSERAAALA